MAIQKEKRYCLECSHLQSLLKLQFRDLFSFNQKKALNKLKNAVYHY